MRRLPKGWTSRDVLLIAGLIDPGHYPEMISAYALSLGGDLVTPLYDAAQPEAIERMLFDHALIGRGVLEPPVSDNANLFPQYAGHGPDDGTITTIFRDAEGGNGHHVAFGFDDVKQRYACFVATHLFGGRAVVGAPKSSAFAPCDKAPP